MSGFFFGHYPPKKAGRAIRYNLFIKKIKRIFTAIPNAKHSNPNIS
jgi:hypothetical protein